MTRLGDERPLSTYYYGSILIFSLAFWLWRLPFILWFPLPEFAPDTFDYYALVEALLHKTPLTYPVDVPLAYPLILYAITLLSGKAIVMIWLQFFLKFISGLLLVYVFCKYYDRWGILMTILLSMYITDSWSLRLDTCFIPDSMYNSFLMLTIALFMLSFKTASINSLFFLSISLFLVAFTRSNGIYIYFLVPVLVFLLWRSKQSLWKYALFLLPLLLLQGSVLYFKSTTNLIHPENNRLLSVLGRETHSLKSSEGGYLHKKWKIAKEYLRMEDQPSFYFSVLPVRYEQLYIADIVHDPNYKMFDWTHPVSVDLRKLVFKEYYTEPEILRNNRQKIDLSSWKTNPVLLMIHLVYKAQSIIFRNVLWYILFFSILVWSLARFLRSGFTDNDALLVILLCTVHLFGLLTVIFGHDRPQDRYVHVSEFILYLSPIFALMMKSPLRLVKGRMIEYK